MTELTSGAHLTTSRANRLLRPLRNKCNSLAALPKPATTSCVTYTKQSSGWGLDSHPPLAVLCPSVGNRKLTLGGRSTDEFEFSRRVHAVCDAFKNIAHVAYGQPCNQRIPSLAAMCALVIGGNMPTTDLENTSVGSSEDPINRDDVLDMDDIYEAVPPHYRRFLIVSHALSMILRICTHHHTLVTTLLDHCLSFGLIHESTYLLNIVLEQAFLPSDSSHLPPATHPAHTNYLLDLHAKWTTGNKPSSGSLLFTTTTFCEAIHGILLQSSSCNSHILWTSKVLNRLLRVIESSDLDSYIVIIHALARSLWETSGSSPDTIQENTPMVLRDKLSSLLSNLFDLLFTQSASHSSPLPSSRLHSAIDLLYECYAARLHCLRTPKPGLPIDLSDTIIVFTTHIFVTFRSSVDNSGRLLAILDDSSPVPTTFSKLMVYFGRLQGGQPFNDSVAAFVAQLETYSSVLRSEKLFVLDASLWACALHHFETSITTSRKDSSTLVTRYKHQLMEAVDAAERRCFGEVDSSPIVSFPIRPSRAKRTKRGRLSGHWEWEGMVESWIRKTPVHKKQKIRDDCPHTPLRRGLPHRRATTSKAPSGSTLVSASLSTCHRRLPTLSPSSSSRSSEPDPDGSEYQYETGKENYPSGPPVVKGSRIQRRGSNFLSLIADAQVNRIVLHPKPHSDPKPLPLVIPEKHVLPLSSQESQHVARKQEQAIFRKVSPPARSRTLLPSDDSLDLFAYGTSSPAR